MDQINLNTSYTPTIKISKITGSLRIKGWDLDKLRADSDRENTLKVEQDNDIINLECSSGCQLRVPTQSSIVVEQVSSELLAKSLEGHLEIKDVKGQIIVKNIGNVVISKAYGNVNAKQIEGDLKFESIFGNVSIRNVDGFIEIEKCDGNLTIRGYSKGLKTYSDGNSTLRLDIEPNGNYEAKANGNISCRVESNTSAQLNLISGSRSIRIRTPEFKEVINQPEYDFTIGEGDSKVFLDAKGNIEFRVLSPSDDFGFEEDFEYLADDISQQISDQIEMQIGSITEQLGNILNSSLSVGIGASEKTRRNLEAKRRALERKLAKTRKRTGRTRTYSQRSYVRQTSDPVSEEEQKKILEMLQNNQISIQEAEVLLAALEGKSIEKPSPPSDVAPPAPPAPPVAESKESNASSEEMDLEEENEQENDE